jgi:hypothetical protein
LQNDFAKMSHLSTFSRRSTGVHSLYSTRIGDGKGEHLRLPKGKRIGAPYTKRRLAALKKQPFDCRHSTSLVKLNVFREHIWSRSPRCYSEFIENFPKKNADCAADCADEPDFLLWRFCVSASWREQAQQGSLAH